MKKFLQQPFTIAIVSALILTPIGSWIYDNTKNVPILTNWILKPLHTGWNWIKLVMTFGIPVWIIIIFALMFFVLSRVIDYSKVATNEFNVSKPTFLKYKRGILKSWTWSWDYDYSSFDNKYDIINLVPVCTECDIKMLEINFGNVWICPSCRNQRSTGGNPQEQPELIRALIANKIEKGNY